MNFSQLVDVVMKQGGFDVDVSMGQGWVNEVYKEAVAASGWLTVSLSLGVTSVGVAAYALPDSVVRVEAVRVGSSASWERVGASDLWALQSGDASVCDGSVFAETFDVDGNRQIEFWPAPSTSGDAIQARAWMVPADLSGTQTPIMPSDTHGRLVAGAIALGRSRIDEREDQAQYYDQKFAEIVSALRQRRQSQVAGEGSRLQVQFVDY